LRSRASSCGKSGVGLNQDLDMIGGEPFETGNMDEELKAHLTSMEDRITERIRDVETRLLTEFHKWASPVEMRVRSHTAALRAMDVEIESLNDRMKKLEDLPPAS